MEPPRPAPAFMCVHCQTHFSYLDGPELPAGLVATATGTCTRCYDLATNDALPPPPGQHYLCYPIAAGTMFLFPAWLCPIGDYRYGPNHWLMDTNACLAYFTLLFPVAILWLSAQKVGRWGIGLIFLLIIAYPFFANHQLGPTALLMDPRFRTSTPSGGAICLWIGAGALWFGLSAMFQYPERFEPRKVTYRRTAKGFTLSLVVAAALLYAGGLIVGFVSDGEFGLRQQIEAGIWRAGLLGLPLAYFFWSIGSTFQDASREIAEQDEARRKDNHPPEA